jgi:hypothetical protein
MWETRPSKNTQASNRREPSDRHSKASMETILLIDDTMHRIENPMALVTTCKKHPLCKGSDEMLCLCFERLSFDP